MICFSLVQKKNGEPSLIRGLNSCECGLVAIWIFLRLLVPEYFGRRKVPIVMPGSSRDLPWPDVRCDYGLFSLYNLEHATKHAAIRARRTAHFFGRQENNNCLCVPHFMVEIRDCTQVSPNNRLAFSLGGALQQAGQIGFNTLSYAAYGACVDLSTGSVLFQGMVATNVCSFLVKSPALLTKQAGHSYQ